MNRETAFFSIVFLVFCIAITYFLQFFFIYLFVLSLSNATHFCKSRFYRLFIEWDGFLLQDCYKVTSQLQQFYEEIFLRFDNIHIHTHEHKHAQTAMNMHVHKHALRRNCTCKHIHIRKHKETDKLGVFFRVLLLYIVIYLCLCVCKYASVRDVHV